MPKRCGRKDNTNQPKIKYGDLLQLALDGEYDLIIQGCNCMCQMGKGIALSIKKLWPEAYEADCKTLKGDANKLGTYTYAQIGNLTICNAYTQYDWWQPGLPKQLADLEAIKDALTAIKSDWSGKKMAYPKIGAGLAGGNWDEIYPIILEALDGEDQTLILQPE